MPNELPYREFEGRRFARVTAVLDILRSPGLEIWRGKVGNTEANKIQREATKLGTGVHSFIQETVEGHPPRLPAKTSPEFKSCVDAFTDWSNSRVIEPLWTEKEVYSRLHGFCGSVDLIEDGMLTDWKTSSRISPAYWMQLNAYAVAVTEFLGMPVEKLRVVRFDKVLGEFEEVVKEPDKELRGAFLNLLKVYKVVNKEELNSKGEDDDYSSSRSAEGNHTKRKNGANKRLGRSKVSDDRTGQDREVGFLEPW